VKKLGDAKRCHQRHTSKLILNKQKMECKKEKNKKKCNCTYPCERKGMCCECIAYHRARGELPACMFSKEAEATYDRSVEKFIEDKSK